MRSAASMREGAWACAHVAQAARHFAPFSRCLAWLPCDGQGGKTSGHPARHGRPASCRGWNLSQKWSNVEKTRNTHVAHQQVIAAVQELQQKGVQPHQQLCTQPRLGATARAAAAILTLRAAAECELCVGSRGGRMQRTCRQVAGPLFSAAQAWRRLVGCTLVGCALKTRAVGAPPPFATPRSPTHPPPPTPPPPPPTCAAALRSSTTAGRRGSSERLGLCRTTMLVLWSLCRRT